MTRSRRLQNRVFGVSSRAAIASLAIVFASMIVATQTAQAQTFTVLHTFTGGADGYSRTAA